ncbi:hypothetical protein CYJ10_11365 [Cupriavidus pauculus]|uniref:Uncharacterized protein n=1 Tax=Cupriavidus pauculus TaxID=82633 RepID=A0A2N5CDG4_9BURK|nr:hypothetical protein CYJ10_11365 [Cupriavidus pauculus]
MRILHFECTNRESKFSTQVAAWRRLAALVLLLAAGFSIAWSAPTDGFKAGSRHAGAIETGTPVSI